jgi:ATP-dependent helicase HrpB
MVVLFQMRARDLPIYELEHQLTDAFRQEGRVVLEAPTGSGKSTQVPQILLESGAGGDGQIVILQPRRLATRMLAARVAFERGVRLGDEVGYQIRFDNVSSARTRIKFVTEGVLLRMMLENPALPGISTVLFDEFHERHLFGDITLARSLQISNRERPDLKIGVMSATLQAAPLQEYLAPCRLLTSQGRTFPVEISYLDRPHNPDKMPLWELAARETDHLLREKPEGDLLVFMPGAYEIHRTISAIQATPGGRRCAVLPLHGELPAADQDAAVARLDQRKVIVSTNVAETSLTIEGVQIVIDSGLARVARFDPYRGINTLLIEKISQASSDQRAGRAGRTAPGLCLRLWTEKEHQQRVPQELPEVRRLDISEVLLTLKASGVEKVQDFPWLDAPDARSVKMAESLLHELGAIHGPGQAITPLGRRMLSFPAHPRFSRMLLAGAEAGCVAPVALAASLTQSRNLLLQRSGTRAEEKREDALGEEKESDLFLLMRAWQYAAQNRYAVSACQEVGIHAQSARQVGSTFQQLLDIAQRQGLDTSEHQFSGEAFRRCLLAGFSDHVARRDSSGTLRCSLTRGRRGTIARESSVHQAPLIIATEVREVETRGKEVTVLLNNVTAIEQAWLQEMFPDDFRREREKVMDPAIKRVVVREQTFFRDLLLESRPCGEASPEEAAPILAEEVLSGRCTLKHWSHAVDQWIARVNCLSRWMPELGLPALGEEDKRYLVEQIGYGAVSCKEIKERPVLPTFRDWLSPEQQGWVEKFAPEQITLPRGRKPKVTYSEDAPPTIAARVQDLYDLSENIRLASGRVEVLVQILAPNQRPVQVTQNIASFWKDSYPAIRKQLQGRYPKHEWR